MSTRGRAALFLAIATIAVALLINLRADAQGGRRIPSRTPTFSDDLLRHLSKDCQLRELPVPGTEQSLLELDFAAGEPDAEPPKQRLKLAQIGNDFVVLETTDRQKIHLPHGMVALFDPN